MSVPQAQFIQMTMHYVVTDFAEVVIKNGLKEKLFGRIAAIGLFS